MFSFVGDTVLDPCMGSGSTNVAARLWGRNSIGYEIATEYIELTNKRLRQTQDRQAALPNLEEALQHGSARLSQVAQ